MAPLQPYEAQVRVFFCPPVGDAAAAVGARNWDDAETNGFCVPRANAHGTPVPVPDRVVRHVLERHGLVFLVEPRKRPRPNESTGAVQTFLREHKRQMKQAFRLTPLASAAVDQAIALVEGSCPRLSGRTVAQFAREPTVIRSLFATLVSSQVGQNKARVPSRYNHASMLTDNIRLQQLTLVKLRRASGGGGRSGVLDAGVSF